MLEQIRVLLVEDHIALNENLSEFFSDARYALSFATDGFTALNLAAKHDYDVIVLDVMLPGLSGFDLCYKIRHELNCTTPIILMTAKDHIADKETGFGCGADDYLVKPFHLRELQLRIEALYRRQSSDSATRIQAGSIDFDPGTLMVSVHGSQSFELSARAARIFEALIRQYPNFISYEALKTKVWGIRGAELHTLRTHVYTLRKQLQEYFGVPLIKTVHSRGYRLVPPGEQ